MIIYFPDQLEANRNFERYVEQKDSNIDRVFGDDSWRDIPDTVARSRWTEELCCRYVERIRTVCAYEHFDDSVRIVGPGGVRLYKLIFCSRHRRGGEFWEKISKRERGGQDRLF